MSNDNAVLVLIGGAALMAAYFYLQEKDKDEQGPPPPPDDDPDTPFADEGWDLTKDTEWARQGRLREEFETWVNNFDGPVVQAIEKARELVRTVARSAQNTWPLQEPLTGRIGRMQDELVDVITRFKGRAGTLAKEIDAYPDQFLQSTNYRLLVTLNEALSAALDKNAQELNRILTTNRIVQNYQSIVTNNSVNVSRPARGQFIQDKPAEASAPAPAPSFMAIEANPRPPVSQGSVIMLPAAPAPSGNRDMQVDVGTSVAQKVAQPDGNAPPPNPVLALPPPPAQSAPTVDDKDPSFAAAEPPSKRRKRDVSLKDRRGAPPPMMPDRPENAPEGAIFNSAPRPDIQPPQAVEMGKQKRSAPEFNQAGTEEEQPKVVAKVENVYIDRLNREYDRLRRLDSGDVGGIHRGPDRSQLKAQAQAIRACIPSGGENGTVTKDDGTQQAVTSTADWNNLENSFTVYVSPEMNRYIEVMVDTKRILAKHKLKF